MSHLFSKILLMSKKMRKVKKQAAEETLLEQGTGHASIRTHGREVPL